MHYTIRAVHFKRLYSFYISYGVGRPIQNEQFSTNELSLRIINNLSNIDLTVHISNTQTKRKTKYF